MADLSLHLVTDTALCGARGVEAVVAAAVRGGASIVQLREKTLETRPFVERARALKALLTPLGVPLLINDRVDVALACGADGVHVGQNDMPPEDVRRLMPGALIGLSIESAGQVMAAERAPVDYYGISPVFGTSTKTDAAPPLGLAGLRRIRAMTGRPLVAIGGIGFDNATAVMDAGADGLAVVSLLCTAADPAEAAARLRGLIRRTA
ncbi:thiamine phosphate synthase [Pelomonas sp. KK5]|uniref:thiamine phosphate synthase n=1 Tax=Pelomonas sp. KK5 TaxID=1855730 RepID=UPI00097BEE22|nr:thiamine phosphate synthase [Pelomonas sp. KK5]